ncbi:hypothetical protein N7467_002831 [Penicillium canescens]|nr:hypothetical protein N7467_002831 [Penicillium canescens]
MASIYQLNQPPNPFWDFLNGNLEDHPFFAPRGHHGRRGHHSHRHGWGNSQQSETVPQGTEAPNAESNGEMKNDRSASDSDSPDNQHRRCDHCGKGNGKGRGGPGYGPGPFRGKGGKCKHGHGPHAGPWGHHNHPYDHAGMFGGRGRGPHHTGGHGKHHGGPPFGGQGFPFNFLRNLGIPMNEPAPEGVDFTPAIDVFDTPAKYMVHVSLPGAKKSDLSIDYDAEESVLRMAGVVHRPGVDENMYQGLAMEERGREVGVFEREVRFGTRAAPAFVAVEGISAKLEDGVLNVVLPKVVPEPEVEKKKVAVKVDDLEREKGDMLDEKVRGDFTPDESEVSDVEDGEAREYVKVPVL